MCRNEEEYEYTAFSDEGEEVSEEYDYEQISEKDHVPVADITGDDEDMCFLQTSATSSCQNSVVFDEEDIVEDDDDLIDTSPPQSEAEAEEEEVSVARSEGSSDDLSFYSLPEFEPEVENREEHRREVVEEEKMVAGDGGGGGGRLFRGEVNTRAVTTRATSACTSFRYVGDEPSLRVTKKIGFVLDDDKINEGTYIHTCIHFGFKTRFKNLYVRIL